MILIPPLAVDSARDGVEAEQEITLTIPCLSADLRFYLRAANRTLPHFSRLKSVHIFKDPIHEVRDCCVTIA